MIPSRPTRNWPSCLSSLALCICACTGSLRSPPSRQTLTPATGAGGQPVVPPTPGTGGQPGAGSEPEAASVAEPGPQDAQAHLLEMVRGGQTLYVRRVGRPSPGCVAVEVHPQSPDASVGEIFLGDERGNYAIHQGHLRASRAGASQNLAMDENWSLNGARRDGVLISGALLSTSQAACESDRTHRPLGLFHDTCGQLPEFSRPMAAEASDLPWVLSGLGIATPCRWAGAYFWQGKRYPFQLFIPLGQAWISGPLAGGSGQPHTVDFHVESGHLKLGEIVIARGPFEMSFPPADAEPALVETGVPDFARDFLAEKRTLHIPLLLEGQTSCAAVDMAKLHGKIRLPTYSGRWRTLEYVKNEFGIEIWRASFDKPTFTDERLGTTHTVCGIAHDHLSVHGRDAESYHVNGSRWFLDGGQCEEQRMHVLPALTHLVNLTRDPCGSPDAHLIARPPAQLRTTTYYVRAPGGQSCVAMELVVPKQPWFQAGYARPRASSPDTQVQGFSFSEVAAGRYLWRSSADPLAGELVEMKPFKQGAQIGETRWYRDEASCRRETVP